MTTVTESIARLDKFLLHEEFYNSENPAEFSYRRDEIYNLCMDIVKAAFQEAGDTAVNAIRQKSKSTE
jgi:hypothetical protein